jgi:hypothetical protein
MSAKETLGRFNGPPGRQKLKTSNPAIGNGLCPAGAGPQRLKGSARRFVCV